MKTCKTCELLLPYDNFTRSKNLKDGFENYCKKCRKEARKTHEKTCMSCRVSFRSAYKNSNYCSPKCRPQNTRNRVKVNCHICDKQKEVTPSHYKEYKHHYCSDECKNRGYSLLYSGDRHHNYNTVVSKCGYCGCGFERWASQIDKYTKSYCSKECQAKDYKVRFSGKNSPTYNHERCEIDRVKGRDITGYPEWRRKVYERDRYTCQACGDAKGGNLVAHHILNYTEHPDLRVSVENGITLCESCHKKFHDNHGYKNNNKKQIKNFITEVKKAFIPQ